MIQLFGFAHLSCLLRFDFMTGGQARICAESGVDAADGFTNMKHEQEKIAGLRVVSNVSGFRGVLSCWT